MFNENHLRKLKDLNTNDFTQDAVGFTVAKMIEDCPGLSENDLDGIDDILINNQLDRASLLDLVSVANDKVAVLAILVWGGIKSPNLCLFYHWWSKNITIEGKKNISEWVKFWKSDEGLEEFSGKTARKEAFDELRGMEKVFFKGVRASYFSKLMYFLNPERNCYIIDKWTALSVNLLYDGEEKIKLDGDGVPSSIKGETYEWYCQFLEELASELQIEGGGAKVEELLFSFPKSEWRKYLKDPSIPPRD